MTKISLSKNLSLLNLMLSSEEKIKFISEEFQEHINLISFLSKELFKDIEIAVELSTNCLKNSGTIFWCGNGGSASDAQHLSTELVCRYIKDREALASIALNTDTSLMTAIPNDYSFEKIFSRQIEALGKPGDLLIPISTSGNSKNILEAIKCANKLNINCFGLLGNNGGEAAHLLAEKVIVPSKFTARIQEAHITIGHIIIGLIEKELKII